ncbi:MFS transporter [Actinospica durhamensis]|uniref:MFS transporter n=1 Tax=Actinospica durhamensis TaxID=1508375 RepID=A0A941IRB2_9ACTN|nr:MFS transporter [Actinospica durhamensis]MBR7835107.1 MFS transporter [Actinospica durhamensis]
MTDTASVPRVSSPPAERGHPWVDGRVRPLPLRTAEAVPGSATTVADTVTTADVTDTARASRFPRLSGRPAIFLLASLVVTALASSAAPTPLYAIYQARWGFSPITTTVVFGVYALAVLVSLLTLGKLSDHLGRRPVLLAALVVQAASLVLFTTADGVPELLAARVIQGLSTGAALGAIGAGMLDIDRERGTFANAVSPGMGTGSGALISALFVRYLPAPTHLIYFALLGVLALQALGVVLMRETVTRKPGALATLVPEIRLPRELRGSMLVAAPVLFAVWAVAGLYGALGPALVNTLTGSPDTVLGSASLTALAGTAVVAVIALRRAQARTVMLTGILALVGGVAVTLLALDIRSLALFFVGTVVSGVGFGSGFQGGIRTVVPQARPHERSGVLSLLYTISYLGMGLPAVIAGFLVVHGGGLVTTSYEYGAAVIVLAAAALAGLLRGRPSAELH